jgi:type II secretory pathway pseudopilin PulG
MLILVLGFMITLFSALISTVEKWKNKGELDYHKGNKIAIAVLIIALAGAALSFFAGVNAVNKERFSENAAKIRQQKIDSQSATIYQLELLNHSLLNKNIDYSKRLDSSSYANYLLSKEIVSQTKSLSDYQSGKGSFCYFDLGIQDPGTNTYHFALYSAGKNPMDNVIARIADIFDLQNNPMGTILYVGKIYPKAHTVQLFETSYTPVKPDRIWLNIFFQTGSREIVEELKEVRLNGKWIRSLIITEEGKVLAKKIDKNFPKEFK